MDPTLADLFHALDTFLDGLDRTATSWAEGATNPTVVQTTGLLGFHARLEAGNIRVGGLYGGLAPKPPVGRPSAHARLDAHARASEAMGRFREDAGRTEADLHRLMGAFLPAPMVQHRGFVPVVKGSVSTQGKASLAIWMLPPSHHAHVSSLLGTGLPATARSALRQAAWVAGFSTGVGTGPMWSIAPGSKARDHARVQAPTAEEAVAWPAVQGHPWILNNPHLHPSVVGVEPRQPGANLTGGAVAARMHARFQAAC